MTTAALAGTVAVAFPPTGIVIMGMSVISGELDAASASVVADVAMVLPTGSARVDSSVLELTASMLELAVAKTPPVTPARTVVVEVKVFVSVV